MLGYHVAEPTAYLAITGMGVDKVVVKKKSMVWPLQRVLKFQITPMDFTLSLHAMTIEKLNFSLPAAFTIGPELADSALTKYAELLTGQDGRHNKDKIGSSYVQNIVKGIIEGETRSIVSTMTMEQLFRERKTFRDAVIKNVQSELEQFGLKIYNANVKELQDTPGSEYFSYLSRKAHEGALNQAKVDVAEARMLGEVGEASRQGQTKQEVAKIHADTAVKETQRKAEKATADAELTNKEIQIERQLRIARIEASRNAEQRDAELQRGVELKRREMEMEKQRATTVTKAIISREAEQEKADADLYTQTKKAAAIKEKIVAESDAAYYQKLKDGEGEKANTEFSADASLYSAKRNAEAEYEIARLGAEAMKIRADAEFYAQKQAAAAMMEKARGVAEMVQALGGAQNFNQFQLIEAGAPQKVAEETAKAWNNLNLNLNMHFINGTGANGSTGANPVDNLQQMLGAPMMLKAMADITGVQPPSWIAKMPEPENNMPNTLVSKS